MKPIMREAKVEGSKDWPNWMPMGNVTMSEAAHRMAAWKYNFSKVKKIPRTLKILVRDQGEGHREFPFSVKIHVKIDVTPIRGDE